MKLIPVVVAISLPLLSLPAFASPLNRSSFSPTASPAATSNSSSSYQSPTIVAPSDAVVSNRYSRGTGRREQCFSAPDARTHQSWCGGKLISQPTDQ